MRLGPRAAPAILVGQQKSVARLDAVRRSEFDEVPVAFLIKFEQRPEVLHELGTRLAATAERKL